VSTILYDGKPEYFAMIVTHPDSGMNSVADLLGPRARHLRLRRQGLDLGLPDPAALLHEAGHRPEKHFARVLHTKHQAIQTQVTAGQLDAGADYNRNRNAMIEQGLIKAERSKVIWQSAPLPNDAFAVSAGAVQGQGLRGGCRRRWPKSGRC
jgi:phosphonate transport system substrate-binding protein